MEAMMKLTPENRRIIEFMSSKLGRFVRGLLGVALVVSAATMGEWYWLLAPFGVFMVFTAAMGYCLPRVQGRKNHREVPQLQDG
ncbi:MAG: DUF2892 domain-containing protein [Actinobacteria bacterium]|nr:DUF2892 domain-containing protein [Actinomycetota bacterium]